MVVGMVALGPLWPHLGDRLEPMALAMATNMSVGMAAWMAVRRHSLGSIAEMTAAMYLSFVVLFPVYWLGGISSGAALTLGHVLMLPAMAVAMLHRPGHAGHHGDRAPADPVPEEVAA